MSFITSNEVQDRIEELLKSLDIAYPPCGFYIGPGWFPIVQDALEKMVALGWDKDLQQVKEKFCGLRIYIGAGAYCIKDDELTKYGRPAMGLSPIGEVIAEAETRCFSTCDYCGGPRENVGPKTGSAVCKTCDTIEGRYE